MNPSGDQNAIERMTHKILESPKYRNLNIPADCVRDLVQREINIQVSPKAAEKKAKEKLHQIIAPYLGDPDYPSAGVELQQAAAEGKAILRTWCEKQLLSHSSTKERFPMTELFYKKILDRIGTPKTVLDLACGMNPFAFPWMGLPDSTRYHAFDLHAPRIQLINAFFSAWGLEPLAEVDDILLRVPRIEAEAAFFFKEAHRFENRRKGSNQGFFQQLNCEWIVVTLPSENLTGQHQMRERQRMLIEKSVSGQQWDVSEDEIGSEMIFFIRKNG